jgi:hypothetical protein
VIDPFAAALGALFSAPGSVAAIYTPVAGAPLPLRLIWEQGSVDAGARGERRVADTNHFDVRRIDVALPARGDMVVLTDPVMGSAVTLRVNGDPILDVEGMTWSCPAEAI